MWKYIKYLVIVYLLILLKNINDTQIVLLIANGYVVYKLTENHKKIKVYHNERTYLTLSEFNNQFKSTILELPPGIAAFGVDMNSKNKIFIHINSTEYIYLKNTVDYWMENIHVKLNKRKYFLLFSFRDGYKFDEISNEKTYISFLSHYANQYIF
jgi:hypothetical protein